MPAPGVGSDAGQTETGGKSEITLFPPALPILATDCFRLMTPGPVKKTSAWVRKTLACRWSGETLASDPQSGASPLHCVPVLSASRHDSVSGIPRFHCASRRKVPDSF